MTRRRLLAGLACLLMVLCVVFSLGLLTHEAIHPHVCAGEDCQVCRFIANLGRSLRNLGAGLLWLVLAWMVMNSHMLRSSTGNVISHASDTPVARMVRMND